MSHTSLEELISLMFSAGRLIRGRVDAHGPAIPYLHVATLRYVAENKQPLMREVATYLRITPPSTTSLVNALVQSGQMLRVADPADRRTVRLAITARGQRALDAGMQRKKESMREIIKGLSEREREQLEHILEKLMRVSAEQ